MTAAAHSIRLASYGYQWQLADLIDRALGPEGVLLEHVSVPGIGDFTLDKPIRVGRSRRRDWVEYLFQPTAGAAVLDRPAPRAERGWAQRARDWIVRSGSKSFYLAKKVAEHYVGGVADVSPANVYLALATTLPDDTTTGTTIVETDYASYARTQIGTGNNQTDAWNASTGTTTSTVTNKNAITCPTATGASTNPITGVAICDAATVGNILYWASVTSTAIANGDTPKVNASALSVVED